MGKGDPLNRSQSLLLSRHVVVEVESLDLKTPVFLFRDCETGDVTALEVLDVDELLKELGL